jgi:branched-chain amino acid transport system permease protein
VTVDQFTLGVAIAYIAMVLIGGLDSVLGAVIGAFLVTALPTLVPIIITSVVGPLKQASQGPALAEIIYGMLVIVFITSSPNGIVGLLRNLTRSLAAALEQRRLRGATS